MTGLNKILAERRMTGKALAKKLNVNEHTISNYRSGKTIPNKKRLEQIADIFNVKPNELL